MNKYAITTPPPTPNGSLHVGHISGPYLAADVFSRLLNLLGKDSVYVSNIDEHQSYVVTKSIERGIPIAIMLDEYTDEIKRSLKNANMVPDHFNRIDESHDKFVMDFFQHLHDKNAGFIKEHDAYYCMDCDNFIFEAYIIGLCPNCISETKGNICEVCGHPNDPINLIRPRCSKLKDHVLTIKKNKTFFLSLEKWRPQLQALFKENCHLSAHASRLLHDLLQEPLLDFPMTLKSDYGLAVDFPGLDGHAINPWGEILPGHLYSLLKAISPDKQIEFNMEFLSKLSGYNLVQFMGYDNTYYYMLVHAALLLAIDCDFLLPKAIVTNEFYLLEHQKFSSGRNHLIWANDLLFQYNSDFVRFFLALTNPESQRVNFVVEDMEKVVVSRVIGPLLASFSAINDIKNKIETAHFNSDSVSDDVRTITTTFVAKLTRLSEINKFSLREYSEQIARYVKAMLDMASDIDRRSTVEDYCNLLYLVANFAFYSRPVMPILSEYLMAELALKKSEVTHEVLPTRHLSKVPVKILSLYNQERVIASVSP